MSGGSMDYLYSKLEYANFSNNTTERKAFAVHLKKIAKALHDIEWVDSCDYGPGDENKAIMECITKADVLREIVTEARRIVAELNRLIREATKTKENKRGPRTRTTRMEE